MRISLLRKTPHGRSHVSGHRHQKMAMTDKRKSGSGIPFEVDMSSPFRELRISKQKPKKYLVFE
jgi:hypothetical protein